MKTDAPKTFRKICSDIEGELCDLKSMAAVLDRCTDGDIAGTAKNGYVMVTEREATAIHWIGLELASKIRDIVEAFNEDFSASLKAKADAH
jgi:hypothetical protein